MKKLTTALAIVAMATTSFATVIPEGTQEIGLSGSFVADTAAGTDSSLTILYGRYVMDQFVVGGAFDLQDNDLGTTYGLGAYTEYNFDVQSAWTPYLGVKVFWAGVDIDLDTADSDAAVLTPYGGVKYFVNDSVALFGQFDYDLASADIYIDDNLDVSSTNYGIELGIRIYIP